MSRIGIPAGHTPTEVSRRIGAPWVIIPNKIRHRAVVGGNYS